MYLECAFKADRTTVGTIATQGLYVTKYYTLRKCLFMQLSYISSKQRNFDTFIRKITMHIASALVHTVGASDSKWVEDFTEGQIRYSNSHCAICTVGKAISRMSEGRYYTCAYMCHRQNA